MNDNTFAKEFRAKRIAAGITQKAVAARVVRVDGQIGVNTTHISDVECGRTIPAWSRERALWLALEYAAVNARREAAVHLYSPNGLRMGVITPNSGGPTKDEPGPLYNSASIFLAVIAGELFGLATAAGLMAVWEAMK